MKEKTKKIIEKLNNPKSWFLILLYIFTILFSVTSIILSFHMSDSKILSAISIICYAIAFLLLTYSVFTLIKFSKAIKSGVVKIIKKSNFGEKIIEQYDFRTIVFALISTIINIAYVLFHVVLAFTTDAFFWYISLASYYGLLVLLRGGIVLYHHKNKNKNNETEDELIKLKKYKNCGICLLIIPFILLIPILQIIFLDKTFSESDQYLSIASAAYTFYKITMAIINVKKANKQKDLTIKATRNIGFADALVSIFSLQTTLLYAFGQGTSLTQVFNIITGSVVCLFTIFIGVMMIINSKTKYKKEKN